MEEFQVSPSEMTGETQQQEATPAPWGWHSQLPSEYRESKALKKFPDGAEGLGKFIKSYGELEVLLGKKGALPSAGVPEKPDGYKLPDTVLSDGRTLDKAKFQDVIHKAGLSPEQASKLWGEYSGLLGQHVQSEATAERNNKQDYQEKMNNVVGELRQEWGEKYDDHINAGQMVINKFTPDQESNDALTAALCSSVAGVKFLAEIGKQFQENSIGSFTQTRENFSDAQSELDSLTGDMTSAYWNSDGKHSKAEHDKAVARVTALQMKLYQKGQE